MTSAPTHEQLHGRGSAAPVPEQPGMVVSARSLFALGVLLVLTGLNLRTMFSSFGAVAAEIGAGAGASALPMTLLSTLPVTLLGVMAPAASWLASRYRSETVIFGAMALLTLGLLLRGTGSLELLAAGPRQAGQLLLSSTFSCRE